jgi:hypothetical protein
MPGVPGGLWARTIGNAKKQSRQGGSLGHQTEAPPRDAWQPRSYLQITDPVAVNGFTGGTGVP